MWYPPGARCVHWKHQRQREGRFDYDYAYQAYQQDFLVFCVHILVDEDMETRLFLVD